MCKLLLLHSVSVTMVSSLNDPYDMCSELHGVIVGVVAILVRVPPELWENSLQTAARFGMKLNCSLFVIIH